jgi:nitronate monooxygenase
MQMYPKIIQGGMGVAVSNWRLARTVAARGQMGVISGTGLDTVVARRLQLGDSGGHLRMAFDAFPLQDMANRVWERYFRPDGKDEDAAFKSKPMPMMKPTVAANELTVVANFVEVFLAKHGHEGWVGINLLEKIQLPTLPSLFGAMLAGVNVVLMGAGIPRQIPAALDSLAQLEPTRLAIEVMGADPGEIFYNEFVPRDFCPTSFSSIPRPKFFAIVASTALATTLVKKCQPPVDGLVVEYPTAGGHNAPPRGAMMLDENNEPIYGEKDVPDLGTIANLGVPFWLAGSYADPAKLEEAISYGAQGVQVGTAFAFCNESGIATHLKREVVRASLDGTIQVFTDAKASPTGFPFKVLLQDGTISQPNVYEKRERICDMGYLRTAYKMEDGKLGYRCASEPVEDYVKKGGAIEDTVGRKCLCNALMATAGYGQVRHSVHEMPILTTGNDVVNIGRFVPAGQDNYSANDVIDVLLGARPVRV